MSEIEELRELAILAGESGDQDAQLAALERIDSLMKDQPGGIVGEGLGALETLGTVATSVLAEPISGLAGLASIPFSDSPGDVVRDVQQAMTFEPRTPEGQRNIKRLGQALEPLAEALEKAETVTGDLGFDVGGPVVGALASAIPTAALEVLGLAAPKAASRIAKSRAGKLAAQADELESLPTSNNLEQVVEQISRADVEDISVMANLDPNFIKAADELNIDVEPLASFASQNPQFRSIEQALAAIPGSQIDAQGKAFVGAVSQKADDLIQRYGGTLDKAGLSQRFRQESLRTVDKLFEQADGLYNKLDEVIPKQTDVTAPNTLGFIEKISKESGGKISPQMAKIKKDLTPDTKTVIGSTGLSTEVPTQLPTYGRLSQLRREVGQALQKGSGPFKDAETGLLKALYSRMRLDQDNVAKNAGALDVSKAADGLIVQRKTLEDSLKNLLGKDLSGSIMVKGASEIKKLAKGDIDKFKSFINDIPEQFRGEVVVSSLNDIFRGSGVDQQALNVTQFSKIMDDINRQPTIKETLYSNLPEGAGKDLDNLHQLAKGISVAQQDKVRTGVVTSLFDEQAGLLRKLLGKGGGMVVTGLVGKATGSPLAANIVGQFLNSKTSKAAAVGDLLASDQFRTLVTDSVRGGVVEGGRITRKLQKAEKALEKSDVYKRWAETLATDDRAKLSSVGLISYLFDEKED